jgi:hypothetical protein
MFSEKAEKEAGAGGWVPELHPRGRSYCHPAPPTRRAHPLGAGEYRYRTGTELTIGPPDLVQHFHLKQ